MSQRDSTEQCRTPKETNLPLFFKEAYEASPAIVREAALAAIALPACLIHGAEESWNDPKGTFDRAVSTVSIGVVLGVVTRRPRALLKIAAECGLPLAKVLANDAKAITMIKTGGHIAVHAFGTIPFLMEAAQPERLNAVGSAVAETWQSNRVDTLYQSRDKVAGNWGRFVFDSVAMLPLAKTGDYIGIKTIDHLRRGPHAPQLALASTFNAFPLNTKAAQPLIDTHLQMVAQATAPHKQPGTDAHKTYSEFNESVRSFAEIRNSIAELQRKGSNLDEAKDLWKAAHELIKVILLAKTTKTDYMKVIDQMALMNKRFTALLEGNGSSAFAKGADTGHQSAKLAPLKADVTAPRALPKAVLDAKLTDVQLKSFETFVKRSRSLESHLQLLNLPAQEALVLSRSVKAGIKTVTALAAECQNPIKRRILDSCLDNMTTATAVMDRIAQGAFKGRELQAQAIVKLLNTHLSNLDQHLAINFEKASSPQAQLKALALYSDLIEQIALKTTSTKDSGHQYETQVTKQIQEALKTSNDHKVLVQAQNYSPADSTRIDGIFIDLAKNQVMPVDFGLTPTTIAKKLLQGKGLWALHLPKAKPAETLEYLQRFENGTYFLEPLMLVIKSHSKELASVIRQKLDVDQLTHMESMCKNATELSILLYAKEQFSTALPQNVHARQRLVDSLNALATSTTTNPQLKQPIGDFLSGAHYEAGLFKIAPTVTNLRQAAEFIRERDNDYSRASFKSLFSDNRDCFLLAGKLLGLQVNNNGFEPPTFSLSNFYSKLGEGTLDSLALPQFRFDPLAAAEHSVKLIKNYTDFVAKHPENVLGQYLLKCAKDSELHRDSVSQIGSSLAIGLAANKLGLIRGEKPGLSLGADSFNKGFDVNGEYLSYDLSNHARKSVRELAFNGSADLSTAIRIYNDGNVRMVYFTAKNGSVMEKFYELGPFEYWNQLADALVKKNQSSESPAENSFDIAKNLMSLVEALELGLSYEREKLGSIFLKELQSSGWLNDGKSHTENAPVASTTKPTEIKSTQIRATANINGRGDVEIGYSTRIPESQFKEALSAYQAVKKANLMNLNLFDMRPTPGDRPADKAFSFFSRDNGINYKVFEFNTQNGVDVVVMNGSKPIARFRVSSPSEL